MKNTSIKLLLLLCFFGTNAQKKTIVSGTISESENNSKIFIEKIMNDLPIIKDSTVIKNGKFEFQLVSEEIDIASVKLDKQKKGVQFVFESGKIEINFDRDSLQKSKISGTYNNNKFQEFNEKSQVLYKKIIQFQNDNSKKMQTAQQSQDTVTINELMKTYRLIEKDFISHNKKFIHDNPKAFISLLLLENFTNNQSLEMDEVKKKFDMLDKSLLENKHAKNIKKLIYASEALTIGKAAPNFSAPSPEGKMISLKESLGKITIIDFWASWCGPCRAENPNVVAMYNKYHSKGLNMIGVSLINKIL